MTVNTLGTDSPESMSAAAGRASRTMAELLWPFLACGVSVFAISALVYYHLNLDTVAARSSLQVGIASLYRTFGLAPSVLFFLLLATWSTIWFVTGELQRPLARFARLLAMAVMLGVFLNLGDGGVVAAVHKGQLGAWLAERLVTAIGYLPSLLLVWATTFAALLLATDFFFSDSFERLRRAPVEDGVEVAVTEHLRGLGAVARPAGAVASGAVAAAGTGAAIGVADAGVEPAVAPAPAPERDAGPAATADDAGERRPSYAERRRARATRRWAAVEDETEAAPAADAAAGAVAAHDAPAGPTDDTLGDVPPDLAGAAPIATRLDAAGSRHGVPLRDEAEEVDEADDGVELDDVDDVDESSDVDESAGGTGLDERELAALLGADALPAAEGSAAALPAAPSAARFRLPDDVELDAGISEADEREAEESDLDDGAGAERELDAVDADGHDADDRDADDRDAGDPRVDEPDASSAALPAAAVAFEPAVEAVASEPAAAPDAAPTPVDERPSVLIPRDDAAAARSRSDGAAEESDADREAESAQAAGESAVPIPRPEPNALPSARQQQLFGGVGDDLVQEAVDVVTGARRATAALLQRKLRIDYELARELLAELAARGIVALDGDASHGRVLDS